MNTAVGSDERLKNLINIKVSKLRLVDEFCYTTILFLHWLKKMLSHSFVATHLNQRRYYLGVV
jgi:hypothetical protein